VPAAAAGDNIIPASGATALLLTIDDRVRLILVGKLEDAWATRQVAKAHERSDAGALMEVEAGARAVEFVARARDDDFGLKSLTDERHIA